MRYINEFPIEWEIMTRTTVHCEAQTTIFLVVGTHTHTTRQKNKGGENKK